MSIPGTPRVVSTTLHTMGFIFQKLIPGTPASRLWPNSVLAGGQLRFCGRATPIRQAGGYPPIGLPIVTAIRPFGARLAK
jgi:hypothetical protein